LTEERSAPIADAPWFVVRRARSGIVVAAQHRFLLSTKLSWFQIQGIFGEPYSLELFKGHILVMQFGSSW
jgi:hypothetical protein